MLTAVSGDAAALLPVVIVGYIVVFLWSLWQAFDKARDARRRRAIAKATTGR